jgi:hypothetical protein
MILESYVQALLKLIEARKITTADIKNEEYKAEIERRLAS